MIADRYRKTTLPGGVRIVTESFKNIRSASIGFWLTAGSRNEKSRLNGISHLLEHMVFKGTSRRSAYDIAVSLESLGGQLNAFTEKEFTCFYAQVLDNDLAAAVDVLSDLIQFPVLSRRDLRIEKEIVFEEYNNLLDSPEDYIHDLFAYNIYRHEALALPILGTPQSFLSIQHGQLTEYFHENYTRDRLIISAAGNVNHDELVSLITQHLDDLPEGHRNERHIRNPVRMPELPIIDSIQSHLCIGFPTFAYKDPRKFALLAIHTYLGSGMSSILFQELREKRGLAYSVYSFTEFFEETGLMGIYAGTEHSNKASAQELIQSRLDRLVKNGIKTEDLERIKSQLSGGLILGMEDSGSRMHRLARMEHYLGEYISIEEVIDAICALTTEEVQHTLTDLNIRDNLTIVSLNQR